MTFRDVMELPIWVFWSSRKAMERIKAGERLAQAGTAMTQNMKEPDFRSWVQNQEHIIGKVVIEAPKFDTSGWSKLKGMSS